MINISIDSQSRLSDGQVVKFSHIDSDENNIEKAYVTFYDPQDGLKAMASQQTEFLGSSSMVAILNENSLNEYEWLKDNCLFSTTERNVVSNFRLISP